MFTPVFACTDGDRVTLQIMQHLAKRLFFQRYFTVFKWARPKSFSCAVPASPASAPFKRSCLTCHDREVFKLKCRLAGLGWEVSIKRSCAFAGELLPARGLIYSYRVNTAEPRKELQRIAFEEGKSGARIQGISHEGTFHKQDIQSSWSGRQDFESSRAPVHVIESDLERTHDAGRQGVGGQRKTRVRHQDAPEIVVHPRTASSTDTEAEVANVKHKAAILVQAVQGRCPASISKPAVDRGKYLPPSPALVAMGHTSHMGTTPDEKSWVLESQSLGLVGAGKGGMVRLFFACRMFFHPLAYACSNELRWIVITKRFFSLP